MFAYVTCGAHRRAERKEFAIICGYIRHFMIDGCATHHVNLKTIEEYAKVKIEGARLFSSP
jgi:hypothetical protein